MNVLKIVRTWLLLSGVAEL